jgi:hypothetical protein
METATVVGLRDDIVGIPHVHFSLAFEESAIGLIEGRQPGAGAALFRGNLPAVRLTFGRPLHVAVFGPNGRQNGAPPRLPLP